MIIRKVWALTVFVVLLCEVFAMALYGVCRMKKVKRSGLYGLGLERNRTADDGRNFARSEIDKELSDFNVVIHGKDCSDFNDEVSRQIKNAGVKEKPDSIVCIGVLFTASADFFTKNPQYVELTEQEQELVNSGVMKDTRTAEQKLKYLYDEKAQFYFERCYRFAVRDIFQGDESRIFSAKIDFDEKTPHLQIYGVPLHERENKKGISKMHLSAKDIFGNRTELRARQNRFFEQVGREYGFERGELVDWDKPYEERKKHEESYAYNMAQRKALEAAQTAKIAQNREELSAQQNELARGRIKLQKQAQAADALVKSKTKRSLFHKDKENVTVSLNDYQKAIGQEAALRRVLDSPVYTPQERTEMEQAAQASRLAQKSYEKKSDELEQIIEQRVQERLSLLNRTEPKKIEQLQNKLAQARNDLEYVCDMVKMFMQDNGLSIEDFEQCYGVRLSDDHNQEVDRRLP